MLEKRPCKGTNRHNHYIESAGAPSKLLTFGTFGDIMLLQINVYFAQKL